MKPRVLSTQDLIDSGKGAIYVLNTTGSLQGVGVARGGDVYITVQVGQASRTLNIPRTWIPIEITASLPRDAVLNSLYFLEAVGKGLVTPINADDALTILSKPDAQSELRRLRERENSIREATKSKGIGRNVTVASSNGDDEDTPEERPVQRKNVSVVSLAGDDTDTEATVSASFQAFVMKLNGMATSKEARNAIKVRGGELSEEEARYMLENIKHEKIQASLRRALGED